MKRIISVLLMTCLLTFSAVAIASASIFDSVIASGEANISATVTGKAGKTTKVTIHLYLQQYKNGKWTDYDDWLESKNGTSLTVSKTVTVPTGYKYRAKASCYAYAGNNCEHVIKYSAEVQ